MPKRPDYTNPDTQRYRLRKARLRIVEDMIRAVLRHKSHVDIIDIGGRADYWDMIDEDLINKIKITVINIEREFTDHQTKKSLEIDCRIGNGCSMPEHTDKSFDIAHSNSVIEHVGSITDMRRFADETRRIGNGYFIQTPYFWFPIEPHFGLPFVHWLPDVMRIRLLNKFGLGFVKRRKRLQDAVDFIEHTRLIDETLLRSFFPDSQISHEKYLFLTKSMTAFRQPVIN